MKDVQKLQRGWLQPPKERYVQNAIQIAYINLLSLFQTFEDPSRNFSLQSNLNYQWVVAHMVSLPTHP